MLSFRVSLPWQQYLLVCLVGKSVGAMASSLEIGLRSVFAVLGCLMLATLIYTISIDDLPFRKDLLTPYALSLSLTPCY